MPRSATHAAHSFLLQSKRQLPPESNKWAEQRSQSPRKTWIILAGRRRAKRESLTPLLSGGTTKFLRVGISGSLWGMQRCSCRFKPVNWPRLTLTINSEFVTWSSRELAAAAPSAGSLCLPSHICSWKRSRDSPSLGRTSHGFIPCLGRLFYKNK